MPEDARERQVRALAFMIAQRNTSLPDKPSRKCLKEIIEQYNDLKREPDVPNSPASLWRSFKSDGTGQRGNVVLTALRETRDYSVDEYGFAPSRLINCISRLSARGKSDERATSWSDNTPTDRVRQIAEVAEKNRDIEMAAKAHNHIAIRMTRPDAQGDRYTAIESALHHAIQGHTLATAIPEKTRSSLAEEWVASCARTAAWALVQLYRMDVRSGVPRDELAKRLDRLSEWKGHEAAAEDRRKRPVAAALARFHQTRAQALADGDAHEEIRAFGTVADVLIERRGDDGTWSALVADLWYHDLNAIITRLCAMDWAYPDDSDYSRLMARVFPDGIDRVVSELMTIYAEDETAQRAKKMAQAIINLKKHTEQIEEAYATKAGLGELERLVSEVEIDEFLHASESAGLTAMGLARYAIAVDDLAKADRLPHSWMDPYSLLRTAQDACLRADSGTHDRTFGQFIRARIAGYVREIENRLLAEGDHQAEAEDETREVEQSEDGDSGHPESYVAAVQELMDKLAIVTLIEARAEDGIRLKDARATIMNTAGSVCRFLGELADESLDTGRCARTYDPEQGTEPSPMAGIEVRAVEHGPAALAFDPI